MKNIKELIDVLEKEGYSELNAVSRISQDILLKAIKDSKIVDNVAIKGGVLMRNISKNIRRSTIDLDIDFIKYSINEKMVKEFVEMLNDNSDYDIEVVGDIEELKHEDYKGKRVYVNIKDNASNAINSKIDIGVHVYSEMELEECLFDINLSEEGICLLANSKEQIIVEKLKSLLKFGTLSTRYKDIFDIDYLLDSTDFNKLEKYKNLIIYAKSNYENYNLVHERLVSIFNDKQFLSSLEKSNKNWTGKDIGEVVKSILSYI